MALNIGKMRHRVEVQESTRTRDEFGGVRKTWATVATRWAEVKQGSVAGVVDGAEMVTVNYEVRMRYSRTLNNRHRLIYNGKVLDIAAVFNVDEQNVETVAQCQHRVATGIT